MEPLDINEIVSEAMNILQHELLRSRVSSRMELSADLPVILGDRIQLQQVLLNLIINGIEAMQPITDRRRELVIRSEHDAKHQARVTVLDCGIGLSPESAHRIFDAFVTTKSSGVGMGLSICRSIIQAHGGRIWASPNEPHGAAVQFTLPLHRPEAP
jgi:signal transduction histidine kinase